jgi:Asp-tRNA(Asn)/Glu-tRNA(Gln) amidotransferase A subunit family amidase
VFGYKPTFGTVTTAGVKPIAQSLDTVGWFAHNVATLDRVRVAITGRRAMSRVASPPRIALVRSEQWLDADPDARDAVEQAAHIAADAGATIIEADLPAVLHGLAGQQTVVMMYEAARSLAWEWHERRDELSSSLVRILEQGVAVDQDDYDAVVARAADGRAACNDDLFANADVVLTLAAAGEAAATREHTGDPRFARLWTLLGVPSVAVPGMVGATGLPIGVQLVGRRGDDARLLACAAWLADVLPTLRAPRP